MNADKITLPDTDTVILINQKGIRVSQESLFLLRFVDSLNLKIGSACVPGCGSGLLAIGLAALNSESHITGIELQKDLADKAIDNVLLNKFEGRITIRTGDIRDQHVERPDQKFDLVVMNPPFRKLKTGEMSPDLTRRYSNHEHHGTLEDFIRAASILLKHKGVVALVMLPERLGELLHYMEKRNISAYLIQAVHHTPTSAANAVLIAGRKGCRSPLTILPAYLAKP